jgi:hypothetical protein
MKRFFDRAFLAGLLAVLVAVPLGVALWSHKETSAYYENRTLAAKPEVTAESLWNGGFGSDFESWFSDHVPGRTTLLKIDTAVQMKLLQRPVVNDIVLDADGVLVPKMSYSEYSRKAYEETVPPIAENFGKLNDHVEENGGKFYFVGFPEQRVYFEDRFPDYMNNHETEAAVADEVFMTALENAGVHALDMRQKYEEKLHWPVYYSAVDHHYTYYGAYYGYRCIMTMLARDGWDDLPVLAGDLMEYKELPNPYIGSRNRKLYNLWEHEEKAAILAETPVPFTRTDNGQPSEKPLFVVPAQEDLPTTYNLYMGGDFGETVLETNRPELPDVLIFGDSFTNALETLLYASFDETRILDLRHYTEQSLKDYITEHKPDIVLCVMNDTFYYTTTGNGAVWED